MSRVEYLDEEPSGLAAMIGGLIEGNLDAHPDREALLKPAVIGIIADDAGVSVTLRLSAGSVLVGNGLSTGSPDLLIRTTSETLMGLTVVPLRFGLPDVLTADGRAVVGKLLGGSLRVRGMFRHLPVLARLQRLLAV